jgi:hypothetical protein
MQVHAPSDSSAEPIGVTCTAGDQSRCRRMDLREARDMAGSAAPRTASTSPGRDHTRGARGVPRECERTEKGRLDSSEFCSEFRPDVLERRKARIRHFFVGAGHPAADHDHRRPGGPAALLRRRRRAVHPPPRGAPGQTSRSEATAATSQVITEDDVLSDTRRRSRGVPRSPGEVHPAADRSVSGPLVSGASDVTGDRPPRQAPDGQRAHCCRPDPAGSRTDVDRTRLPTDSALERLLACSGGVVHKNRVMRDSVR